MIRNLKYVLLGGVLILILGIAWLRSANKPSQIPSATNTPATPADSIGAKVGPSSANSVNRVAQESDPSISDPVAGALEEDISTFAGAPPNAEAVRLLHSTIQTLAAIEVEKRKNTGAPAAKFLGSLQRTMFARDWAYSAIVADWGDCTNGKAIFERSVRPRLEKADLEGLEEMRGWR